MGKLALIAACGATLAGTALFSPIVADATTSQTIHLNGVPIDVGPSGCLNGDVVIMGNGVEHLTVNNAGDSWLTGTIEGTATVSDVATNAGLWSGHAAAWFGVEGNAKNFVNHFTLDGVGTLADGSVLRIHQEGQFTFNAQGVITVNRVTATCS
jgi:hypothetical protein